MRESILDRIDGGVADVFCYFSILKPLYEGFDTCLVPVFLVILWHVVKDRFLDPFSVSLMELGSHLEVKLTSKFIQRLP